MIKKLFGCSLAAVLALQLWSTVPNTGKRLLKKIQKIERSYKAMIRMTEEDTNNE